MSDVNPTDGQPPVIEVGLAFATVQDAARQLGVPVTFLRREVKDGRVPSIRMGSSVRVNVRAVKAALERQAAGEYADSLFGQLPLPAPILGTEIFLSPPVGPEVNPRAGRMPGTV